MSLSYPFISRRASRLHVWCLLCPYCQACLHWCRGDTFEGHCRTPLHGGMAGLKNWAPRNAEAAEQLVLSYHDVFALDKNELGCTSTVEHEIHIVDSEPFKERFRRIPPLLLEEVHASLRDMLDAGTIRPSQSPWCNTIMLVRKKEGTLHFCMDFRWLNTRTKKDSYSLPRIQEALESMASAAHFSLMDLKSRFWQVKMVPGSQPYMAFTVGNLGFYEFTWMPFGLCNMPATFQS